MAIHAIHVNNTTVVTDTDIPENVAFTAHQETLDLGRSMKDQRLFDYVLKVILCMDLSFCLSVFLFVGPTVLLPGCVNDDYRSCRVMLVAKYKDIFPTVK